MSKSLGALVITAAVAAVFLSIAKKSNAMQDAVRAGDISSTDEPGVVDAGYSDYDYNESFDFGMDAFMTFISGSDKPTMISDAGIDALKARESFSAVPYFDHQGYSIGYGHLILPGEAFDSMTEGDALTLLASDLLWAVEAVAQNVQSSVSQNQFDALVSFCFNVGATAFKNSTLLRKTNAGDFAGASREFSRWIYARNTEGVKIVNNGLITRRESEEAQFLA